MNPIPGTKNVYRLPVVNKRTMESPKLSELMPKHEPITQTLKAMLRNIGGVKV